MSFTPGSGEPNQPIDPSQLPATALGGASGDSTEPRAVWTGTAFIFLRPTFRPETFAPGAYGGGSQDDRPALSACLTAATAAANVAGTSVEVLLPPGITAFQSVCPNPPANPRGGLYDSHIGIGLPVDLAGSLTIRGHGTGVTRIQLADAYARCAFWIDKQSPYDTFQNVTFEDFDVDNNGATGRSHIVIGNQPDYGTAQTDLNVANITVRRVSCYGVPYDATGATTVKGAVMFIGARSASDPGHTGTQTSTTAVTCEDIVTTSQQGFCVNSLVSAGFIPNHFYDQIVYRRCRHFTGRIPVAALQQTSFYICGAGYGDRYLIEDCSSDAVGDDAIEIGAMQNGLIRGFRADNPFLEAIMFRNSQSPPDPLTQRHVVEDMVVEITAAVQTVAPSGFIGRFAYTKVDNDATGTVNLTAGSTTATAASPTAGVFLPGQVLAGSGIDAGTRITAVSGATLTLSSPASATAAGVTATGTLDIGELRFNRPRYHLNGVSYNTLNRARIGDIGYMVAGPVQSVHLIEPELELRNMIYDSSSTVDFSLILANLTPPVLGASTPQSSARFVVRDARLTIDTLTFAGSGSPILHGLWAIGRGEVDVDGVLLTADDLATGVSSLSIAEIGRAGALDLIRLRRIRAIATNTNCGRFGVQLNAGGTFAMLDIDEIDFRRWTSSAGHDVNLTGAPPDVGPRLLIGKRNLWSNSTS